ncbi:MAG: aminoacyltransferase, partial [Chloroflexi bacterium]|nr:aminoacyltransferase [Chloroflexota bacterium]
MLKSDYTQALLQMPDPHPLQSWTWGEFKSRWGWQKRPLILGEDRPQAVGMVLKRALPRTPFSILYAPKGPALDYTDVDLRQTMLTELEQLARREKAIFIKIDPDVVKGVGVEPEPSAPGAQFINELQERGWRFSADQIQFRNTVEMDLTLSEDDLLAAMKSKTRYNIRLAGRKGIVVRPGMPDDFSVLAEMYRETAGRDGFAIRP